MNLVNCLRAHTAVSQCAVDYIIISLYLIVCMDICFLVFVVALLLLLLPVSVVVLALCLLCPIMPFVIHSFSIPMLFWFLFSSLARAYIDFLT